MPFALSEMTLTSTVFSDGQPIPQKFTGDGDDVSPPLFWENPPGGTRSFTVICHDPDAPLISSNGTYGFVHWVVYNLPASADSLAEGSPAGTPGKNNFGKLGYGGPQPPEGHGLHRYYFWVLALDTELRLDEGLSLWQLLETIEPNVIGMNRLVGTYQRD